MEISMIMPLAMTLAVCAALFWWLAAQMQRRSGLPRARVAYDDASATRVEPPPLVDHQWRIAGRPDYLLQDGEQLIPVEVKPRRRARQPYASDVMQLAAYCRLVETHYGKRPRYGLLRYASDTFEIPYSAELEAQLRATLDLMSEAERANVAHRSHQEAARCRACSQRANCDEALV